MEGASSRGGAFSPGAPGPERAWGTCVHVVPVCPPDVDECAWDAHLCQEGQRCVNLFGSYHCLPDCRPGFRVAPHGAGCEGDGAGWVAVRTPVVPGFRRGCTVCHWASGLLGKAELSWQEEQ